jgi:hypothetical protein
VGSLVVLISMPFLAMSSGGDGMAWPDQTFSL